MSDRLASSDESWLSIDYDDERYALDLPKECPSTSNTAWHDILDIAERTLGSCFIDTEDLDASVRVGMRYLEKARAAAAESGGDATALEAHRRKNRLGSAEECPLCAEDEEEGVKEPEEQ